MSAKPPVFDENSTFTVNCGPLKRGPGYHRHNDIEIILMENGAADYLLGGNLATIKPNQFAVFWGSIPHTAIRVDSEKTIIYWVHLPLARFLQWEMPKEMISALMSGKILLEDKGPDPADLGLAKNWVKEYRAANPALYKILLLEIQTRLCRLALRMKISGKPGRIAPQAGEAGLQSGDKSMEIMRYITEHYTESLTSQDIARVAGLNLENAVSLFQKSFGTTFLKFITQMRISHAQRMLVTTNDKILEIALESGFGSESRFYAVFKRHCGQSPHQYRHAQQGTRGAQLL